MRQSKNQIDTNEDIEAAIKFMMEAECHLIEDIAIIGNKIEIERDRQDSLHRTRMSDLDRQIREQLDLYIENKKGLGILLQRRRLTNEQRKELEFLRSMEKGQRTNS